VRKITRIVAIAAVLSAFGLGAAVPAQAAGRHESGTCHAVQRLGVRGSVCIGTSGDSIVARASFTSDGPLPPVPVRLCVVIYNADIGAVGGVCRYVSAGVTVTASTPWHSGVYAADAFILKPFWLDFGATPALTT
jgi:hypothetical protein